MSLGRAFTGHLADHHQFPFAPMLGRIEQRGADIARHRRADRGRGAVARLALLGSCSLSRNAVCGIGRCIREVLEPGQVPSASAQSPGHFQRPIVWMDLAVLKNQGRASQPGLTDKIAVKGAVAPDKRRHRPVEAARCTSRERQEPFMWHSGGTASCGSKLYRRDVTPQSGGMGACWQKLLIRRSCRDCLKE